MVTNIGNRTPNRRTLLDKDDRLERLLVRGSKFKADVARRITSASLDLTTDGVSELKLTVSDPDLELLEAKLFEPGGDNRAGSRLDYGDGPDALRFEVAAVELGDSGSGPVLDVTARSMGGQRLRRARGALIRKSVTPTEFAQLLAKDAGLEFVGQKSPERGSISRQTGDSAESSWDTIQRLAKELGYIAFEAAGVLYFGQPTWLVGRDAAKVVRVKPRGKDRDERVRGLPRCRRSGDDPRKVASVSAELYGTLGDDVRPGHRFVLDNVPTFAGRYLVTRVGIPLQADAWVSVEATTPVNPEPEPPEKRTSSSGSSSSSDGGPAPSGRGTASAFVAVALSQAGDRYVYGAEASGADANPAAFDCSELVQWALARVGVSFVDGSSAQIAACRAISVEQAIRTRGALLWHPGHIAISLGDGRTIEAANPSAGVTSYGAAGRFQRGGLVPGLAY